MAGCAADTLDQWLNEAVAHYTEIRGKRGNKCHTGEGDDPNAGELAGLYSNPEIELELAALVEQGLSKHEALPQSVTASQESREIAKNMMERAMGEVKAEMERGGASDHRMSRLPVLHEKLGGSA